MFLHINNQNLCQRFLRNYLSSNLEPCNIYGQWAVVLWDRESGWLLYYLFNCPFFVSFQRKFSQELSKLQSSHMACSWRMSDRMVGLRSWLIAPIFHFLIHFSFFAYFACWHLKIVSEFSQWCIVGFLKWAQCSYYQQINKLTLKRKKNGQCPFFFLLRVNLFHSFLRICASYNLPTSREWLIRTQTHCSYFSINCSFFFLFIFCILTLELCVRVFKLGIPKDNE